jgi:hypothetical protein
MLYIVDGTGAWFNSTYSAEMAASFCSQLHKELGKERSMYWRGPSLLGLEVGLIASAVSFEIHARPREPVYLAGYSRGGAAVMLVARMIRPRPVAAMFLFDAVDRALVLLDEKVSGSVARVYHARRDPGLIRRYEGELKANRARLAEANAALARSQSRNPVRSALFGTDHKVTVAAREAVSAHGNIALKDRNMSLTRSVEALSPSNFGNTGLGVELPGTYEEHFFRGSHGAVGGVPWPDDVIEGDRKIVPEVRSWMWARLIREGVGARPG